MSISTLQLFVPVLSIAVCVLVQFHSVRYTRVGLLKSFIAGALAGCIFLSGLEIYCLIAYRPLPGYFIGISLVNIILYLMLTNMYFSILNMGETARRVRILRELYDARDGLSREELLQRYNAREIIQRRLNRLLDNGQLLLKDGRLMTGKPLMLAVALSVVFIKLLLVGKKSEFD